MSTPKTGFAKYVSQASASRVLRAMGYVFAKSAKIEIRLLANVVWVRVAGFNLGRFVSYADFLQDAIDFRIDGAATVNNKAIKFDSFGSARVVGNSGTYVVNTHKNTCTCEDHVRFPELQCKHQIAVGYLLTAKHATVSMVR